MTPAPRCIFIPPHRRIDRQADFGGPDGLARLARAAEDAGFWALTGSDHLLVPVGWSASGGHHDLDPFSTLGYLAAVTERIRLMTFVLVLAYRHPAQAAKALATIDVLSKGRLEVGIGAGYLEGEFAALGVPFEERNRRTDDHLAAIVDLWSGGGGGGGDVEQLPRPVQHPRPPIWVGGNSLRAMRRAVELGDGWLPFFAPPALTPHLHTAALGDLRHLTERVRMLREMEAEAGRERPVEWAAPTVVVAGGASSPARGSSRPVLASAAAVEDHLGTMTDAGATAACISFSGSTVDEQVEQLGWFGVDVLGGVPA